MCFNYKVSLFTFCLGTFFSILLINYGNKKYVIENKIVGTFFIFISAIQLMEFLFWIDIKNKFGINKVTTTLGPILNVLSPNILYLTEYYYYKPNLLTFTNLPIAILNLLYFVYFLIEYAHFLTNGKLTAYKLKNGHLKWPWIEYFSCYFYEILLAINIFYIFYFNYALLVFLVTYFFLYISTAYFKYNIGEFWCFFGSFIPLIIYFGTFYL